MLSPRVVRYLSGLATPIQTSSGSCLARPKVWEECAGSIVKHFLHVSWHCSATWLLSHFLFSSFFWHQSCLCLSWQAVARGGGDGEAEADGKGGGGERGGGEDGSGGGEDGGEGDRIRGSIVEHFLHVS